MRTPAQQQASRTNGAKSQGPVTPEGKARVSQNGTTHGIYSKRVVVKGEDPQAFTDMLHALVTQWSPVNDFEHNLITDIAEARWRLARFLSLSTEALDLQVEMMRPTLAEDWPAIPTGTRYVLAFNEAITRNRTLEVLESAIAKQHRIIQAATRQLIQLRKIRPNMSESGDTGAITTTTTEQTTAPEPTASNTTAPTPSNNTSHQPKTDPNHPQFANNKSKPEPAPQPTQNAPQTNERSPQTPTNRPEIGPQDIPKAA